MTFCKDCPHMSEMHRVAAVYSLFYQFIPLCRFYLPSLYTFPTNRTYREQMQMSDISTYSRRVTYLTVRYIRIYPEMSVSLYPICRDCQFCPNTHLCDICHKCLLCPSLSCPIYPTMSYFVTQRPTF